MGDIVLLKGVIAASKTMKSTVKAVHLVNCRKYQHIRTICILYNTYLSILTCNQL